MLDFVRAVTPRSWLPPADLPMPADMGYGQREAVCIEATLEIGGRVIRCTVVELSTRGACIYLSEHIAAHDTFVGQLGLLRHFGGNAISVTVRAFTDMSLNVRFLHSVGLDAFTSPPNSAPADVQQRSGRAKVKLKAQIVAGADTITGTMLNISGGGALIRTDKPCNPTTAIMIQCDLLRPMGGYVRWRNETLLGIMFNRLLPMSNAETIAETFAIHPIWLEEIIECHRD